MLNHNYQVNIFASRRTKIFAAALGSDFNAVVKKNITLKLRKYAHEHLLCFGSGVVLDCIDS